MIAELDREAAATRQMLERVPADKLEWRPHERSMSLGELAYHLAMLNGNISNFLETDGLDVTQVDFSPATPNSKDEILEGFEASVQIARTRLDALEDDAAMSSWSMMKGAAELATMPKIVLARSLMFNHLYHHRGQLSVYLRLLDVPVPVSYGRTADENPFG